MPSFNIARSLRRSKTALSPAAAVATLVEAKAAPTPNVHSASSLIFRPDLLLLSKAQARPELVYRSVSHLPAPEADAEPTLPSWAAEREFTYPVIFISHAQVRDDIKYRPEGFEMKVHRGRAVVVRADGFF